jgi:hypothetical protein
MKQKCTSNHNALNSLNTVTFEENNNLLSNLKMVSERDRIENNIRIKKSKKFSKLLRLRTFVK